MNAPKTIQEPVRDLIGRVLYEEPPHEGDWYLLSEERREPWRRDADRILLSLGGDPRRMRAALLYVLGLIEAQDAYEIDIDAVLNAVSWGLGKNDISDDDVRAKLEALI